MRTVVFDVETHDANLLFSMPPEEFVRLIGYKVNDGDVVITTDLEELREVLRSADLIVGHNIHDFDLRAVFGIDSDEPLLMTEQGRVFDTWTHAVLVHPAPVEYVNRKGQTAKALKPEQMKKWFALDEQAHQLGVPGKTHDLKELAKEFGGFGLIPVDDPRFIEYLRGDVLASEAVAKALWKRGPMNPSAERPDFGWYAFREQCIAARMAVISSNGFRVDVEAAQARVDELSVRREDILQMLEEKYGFPTEGAAPWDTLEGKRAILAVLADHGITPETRPDWPKTPVWAKREEKRKESLAKADELVEKIAVWWLEANDSSLPARSRQARQRWMAAAEAEIASLRSEPLPPAFGLSLGGNELLGLTEGTEAEDIGFALAELKGQRSLAQLALDSTHPDGFVHPEITTLQRSGRSSTTKPGLTVWTARGEGAVEKAYFIPDNDDEVLLEIDYSNADARIVAALSGDTKYAERFEPGADGHMINAIAAWGEAVVATDPKGYRQKAKVPGHGWGYRVGPGTLSRQTGMEFSEAKKFLTNMNKAFSVVVAWQDRTVKSVRNGLIWNDWGRPMQVEKGREFTQAPALLGQSGTREIAMDAILRMPIQVLRSIKAFVHDAIVFSVPKAHFEKWRDGIVKVMEASFKPRVGGQLIDFPVEAGPPGANWYEAGH